MTHSSVPTAWRLRLLEAKMLGRSPEIPWTDVLLAMIPERLFKRWAKAVRRIPPLSEEVHMIRREGSDVLWQCPLGNVWAGYTDGRIIAILVGEQLEQHAYDLDPVCVRDGDVVVDAGAHLGVFTRFALSRGARKIIAFEPNDRFARYYRKTFAEEIAGGKVHLVNAAVWRQRETLRFDDSGADMAGGTVSASATGGVEVAAVTIDGALKELGVEHVDFIKMDVEGAERHALAGAALTIQASRPRMTICSYHLVDDVQVLPDVVFGIAPEYRLMRRRDHDYYYMA